ncbi:glycogen-binding subunit 76A [Drosophila tropicalis]|uniref:glycogen-binding subunit 76A n=1 Tax=Drosophila tropicalis TaxID=46794 RepID=UPI0035AB6891
MNDPGDIPLTQTSNTPPDPDNRPPCSIISIIPTIGMSSCRGRAEAFARSLSSKLRTLGSQNNEVDGSGGVGGAGNAEAEPIINGSLDPSANNTWVNAHESEQTVTDLQPLRHESDSFFDFDCELESPGSPVDECEYLRLIETASNTPHNSTAESGYACASAASSHSSSTDGPYFDAAGAGGVGNGSAGLGMVNDLVMVTTQPQSQLNGLMNGNGNDKETLADEFKVEETVANNDDEALLQSQILSELHHQSNNLANDIIELTSVEERLTNSNGHLPEAKVDIDIDSIDIIVPATEPPTEIVLQSSPDISPDSGVDETDKEKTRESPTLTDGRPLCVDVEIAQLEQAKQDVADVAAKSTSGDKHSHMDTTDDEDDCRPQRVRRCSSLKTGKTPPGTPGRKKIVRFADVLGLDLADVKTFLDEIPTIPKSAFEDLEILESEPPLQLLLGPKPDRLLMPLFQQPGGLPTFLDAVREKQVSLENAAVTDNINQTISGSVRVRNLDFHKSVHIRYSLDGWRSYADLQANYVENSCDGFSDKFTFVLFGNSLHVGQRLEFAVRFQCKGQQFWDNNYGANYCFQCLPSSTNGSSNTNSSNSNSSSCTVTTSASVATGAVSNSSHASSLVGLLSPTAGDAWCSSFY